MQYNKA